MSDFKKRIRDRLAEASDDDADFDQLSDLVDSNLDDVSGGFTLFGEFIQFRQGPGEPGPFPVPQVPKEL